MEKPNLTIPEQEENLRQVQKLWYLYSILNQTKNLYKNLSSFIKDKHVRMAVSSIATGAAQYAGELKSQILSLGGEIEEKKYDSFYDNPGFMTFEGTKQLLQVCTRTEKEIIHIYKEVLKDGSLHEQIKSMLEYQVLSFSGSFGNIRLLYTCQNENE